MLSVQNCSIAHGTPSSLLIVLTPSTVFCGWSVLWGVFNKRDLLNLSTPPAFLF